MSKDADEIVGGEGREQSISVDRESAKLINYIYDSSLKTLGIASKEEMNLKMCNFNCDEEVVSYLNKILTHSCKCFRSACY